MMTEGIIRSVMLQKNLARLIEELLIFKIAQPKPG
jgi:hypothetical protein